MKRITFPHMGTMNVSVSSFIRELGAEPVPPPPITKKTMNLGVKNSPEFACLPLKVNLGNYIEALEKGADCILMAGGIGPCRFGYYAEVQREILRDLGYDVQMLTIEPNPKAIYHSFKTIHGGRIPLTRLYRMLQFVMAKVRTIDELERVCHYVRPRTAQFGELNVRFKKLLEKIEFASSISEVMRIREEGEDYLYDLLNPAREEVLHVGIVGEIYVVLEPYVNLYVEERLGKLGVQVHRDMFLSHWIEDHVLKRIDRTDYLRAAAPYLNAMVGGHGQETIGRSVLYARDGLSGIVQLAPFTCMPEIVAESIFPVVSKKEGVPILSFFFDEHSGEAGVQTRLEAFVDLIRKNQRRQEKQGLNTGDKTRHETEDRSGVLIW